MNVETPSRRATRAKVLIVDDHAIFREGLAGILKQDKDLSVCGEAADAAEAMRQVERLRPDLVTVDVSMEGMSGVSLTKDLRAKFPDLKILVLSMHKDSVYAERSLRAGANGYVMKQESGKRFLQAIRNVLDGKTDVSERVGQAILQGMSRQNVLRASPVDALGVREFEVFRMIADGIGSRQMADQLHVSIKTIESHRGHMRRKLGLKSTSELVRYARDWMAASQNE